MPSSVRISTSTSETYGFSKVMSAESQTVGQPRRARPWCTWRTLLASLPILVIAPLTAVLLRFSIWATDFDHEYGCDPLGNIWAGDPKPNLWNVKYALTITAAFGDFAFPTAKGINIVWNFAIGLGLQIAAAWALYHLFRGSMANCLQSSTGKYDTRLAIFHGFLCVSLVL